MRKKRKQLWPSMSYLDDVVETNKRAFHNKEKSTHRIKLKFLCNFWAWSNVFIV